MKRHAPGYTLVEYLMYIAVVSVLFLFMVDVLYSIFDMKTKLVALGEVNQNSRISIDRMSLAVMNAQSITSPATGTSATSLVLAMPTAYNNPTVFAISNGVLQIKEGSSATSSLTSDDSQVVTMKFTNMTATGTRGTIRIMMTVSSTNPNNAVEFNYGQTLWTTANIRENL